MPLAKILVPTKAGFPGLDPGRGSPKTIFACGGRGCRMIPGRMRARQTMKEGKMRCPKSSSVLAVLLLVAVVLLGANAALADDLEVSFVLPASVSPGVSFPLTINVHNNTGNQVTFNKVAVGYALADWKIKGPYEVDTSTHNVSAQGDISFTVNFRIFYGSGTIVPVAVILAQNSYQGGNIKGGGIVGIKVQNNSN
jgi:hypothetical protein